MSNYPVHQHVFNTVVKHLATQGRQSAIDGADTNKNTCAYRMDYQTEDGDVVLKCAVGCLIPDNEYRPKMEWKRADTLHDAVLDNEYGVPLPVFTKLLHELDRELYALQIETHSHDGFRYGLLFDLQRVHDVQFNWRNLFDMHAALRTVAKNYHLDAAVIDQQDWSKFEENARRIRRSY